MNHDGRPESTVTLSAAGRARRDAMLEELMVEVGRVRRARSLRRRCKSAVALALLLGGVALLPRLLGGSGPSSAPVPPAPVAGPVESPSFVPNAPVRQPDQRFTHVQRLSTDPAVLSRFAPAPANGTIEIVDDSALLRALAEIGRPAGLIEIDGREIVSAPVTDKELFGG